MSDNFSDIEKELRSLGADISSEMREIFLATSKSLQNAQECMKESSRSKELRSLGADISAAFEGFFLALGDILIDMQTGAEKNINKFFNQQERNKL